MLLSSVVAEGVGGTAGTCEGGLARRVESACAFVCRCAAPGAFGGVLTHVLLPRTCVQVKLEEEVVDRVQETSQALASLTVGRGWAGVHGLCSRG